MSLIFFVNPISFQCFHDSRIFYIKSYKTKFRILIKTKSSDWLKEQLDISDAFTQWYILLTALQMSIICLNLPTLCSFILVGGIYKFQTLTFNIGQGTLYFHIFSTDISNTIIWNLYQFGCHLKNKYSFYSFF